MPQSSCLSLVRCLALVGGAVPLAGRLSAQDLDLRVVSAGCSVSLATLARQELAPNTDVSTGYTLEVDNGRGSLARSQLVVARSSTALDVDLNERSTFNAAGTGLPEVLSRLDLILRTPRAARVRMEVDCAWNYDNQPFMSGVGALVGAGVDIRTAITPGQLHEFRDLDLPANSPVTLRLSDLLSFQVAPANIDWSLRFTAIADDPCSVTSYGSNCGLTLAIGADLTHTGSQFAQLRLQGTPVAGILVVGARRAAVPIGPCTLYNDALVVLVVPASPLYFDTPAISGFTFMLQGAGLDAGNLVASEGVQLTRR